MDGKIWGVLAAALAMQIPPAAFGQGASPGRPSVSACVGGLARKLDFTGVVSVQGRQAGAGTYTYGRYLAPDTRFNLASAGKMFTAVAVAQLVDAGKARLDDPIQRYVHGLTPQAGAATVRQLLTHSAGLGNYFTPDHLSSIRNARNAADLLSLVASETPRFPPGSGFGYSNTGFLLLGIMIERVTGQSYAHYLRAHVFMPAGMAASGMDPDPAATRAVGLTAMPSMPGDPSQRVPLRPAPEAALPGSPAGGAYSTAADMQRFFAALLGGRLTSPAMVRALTSRQIVARPASGGIAEADYGLGFGVGEFEGHRWFGHNGGAPGVNAEAAAYADDGSSIVVLSNRDPPVGTEMFRGVREMLFNPSACAPLREH